jgi:hypothetical protein
MRAPRFLSWLALLAALVAQGSLAQLPTSQGQRLAPRTNAEEHLSDLTLDSVNALGRAKTAAAHCDPKALAEAVSDLQRFERESATAASTARLSGDMSLVRPEFAESIHSTIANELETARGLKPNCPQNQQQPTHTASAPPNPPPPPPPPTNPVVPGSLGPGIIKDPFDQLEDDAEDALDELDEAMDRCDEAWVKSLIPQLEDLSREAHAAAAAARAAGEFSLVKASEAAAVARDLDEAIADAKKFKCPLTPFRGYRVLPIFLSPMDQRIVYIHNSEREAVHAPPLRWNFKLEWDATAYAQQLAVTRQLVHAPREGRGIERENLLQALPGWSPDRMMQSWTMEKRDFTPGYFPNVARDGDWLNVAHYTQMIWPTTTDIGCGYATGGGYGWLVCRYSPGGNKDGKPVGLPSGYPERG